MYSCGERVINTFENRIPNGSLEVVIIANNEVDFDGALCVADFLPNNECKLDFLRQYVKDSSETPGPILKKSLEFF